MLHCCDALSYDACDDLCDGDACDANVPYYHGGDDDASSPSYDACDDDDDENDRWILLCFHGVLALPFWKLMTMTMTMN